MSRSVIARRYALALLNLAAEQDAIDAVAEGLDGLADVLEASPFVAEVLTGPELARNDRLRLLDEMLNRVQPPTLVKTFVQYLDSKRRLELLTELRPIYHRLADERLGRAQAEVTVAGELDAATQERLRTLYEKLSGKRITLTVKVDPDILGGAITRIGSTVYDGSLKNALKTIETAISQE